MTDSKNEEHRYRLCQAVIAIAILIMVVGLILFMGNQTTWAWNVVIYGFGLLFLSAPVAIASAIVYAIIDQKNVILQKTFCNWKDHKIEIKLKEVQEMPSVADIFVYVDDKLVAQTDIYDPLNPDCDEEEESYIAKGHFLHYGEEVTITVKRQLSDLNFYFASRHRGSPDPSEILIVTVGTDIIKVGEVSFSSSQFRIWGFIQLCAAILLFVCASVPYASNRSKLLMVSLGILLFSGSIWFWKQASMTKNKSSS
jgi:uncharacterized membrane protein YgdD (TMEM256/DUF423 family)